MWIHAYIVFCEFFVKAITLQSIFVLVLSKQAARVRIWSTLICTIVYGSAQAGPASLPGNQSGETRSFPWTQTSLPPRRWLVSCGSVCHFWAARHAVSSEF